MKTIILTIDYELFFGSKTGDVLSCMINPTNALSDALDFNGSKMTVFWDVLHYYRLKELSSTNPNLLNDINLLEQNIIDLYKKGNDIQLHLHPHWLDAGIVNGSWKIDYKNFKLQDLNSSNHIEGEKTIQECFANGVKLIEDLLTRVDPKFRVNSFRAGGYFIEPFEKLRNSMIANNIFVDSTVCPNIKSNVYNFEYDFENYPKLNYYYFNNDLKKVDQNGTFLEIPIKTIRISVFKSLYFTLIRRLKYSHLNKERVGNGSPNSYNDSPKLFLLKVLKLLTTKKVIPLTTDGNFKEKINYLIRQSDNYATMILHPKLLNHHVLEVLGELTKLNKVKFISIDYFVKNIINGDSKKLYYYK